MQKLFGQHGPFQCTLVKCNFQAHLGCTTGSKNWKSTTQLLLVSLFRTSGSNMRKNEKTASLCHKHAQKQTGHRARLDIRDTFWAPNSTVPGPTSHRFRWSHRLSLTPSLSAPNSCNILSATCTSSDHRLLGSDRSTDRYNDGGFELARSPTKIAGTTGLLQQKL